MFLSLCSHLIYLDLTNNGISQKENYRQTVKSHIPQLAILDQVPYDDVNDDVKMELARSDYHQTIKTSNQILRDVNSRFEQIQVQGRDERPTSASSLTTPPILPVTHISIGRRPTTSDGMKTKYDVSVGEPVCGSIIAKARKPRKLRTCWGDSISSSSSSFSSYDSSTSHSVDHKNRRDVDESSEMVLQNNAKMTREKSRERRGKFKNK